MSQKRPKNEILEAFDKNVMNSYLFFLLEYESTNCLLTFCTNRMSRKNLVPELWPKNLLTNQNARILGN